jgi:hypothetical protein
MNRKVGSYAVQLLSPSTAGPDPCSVESLSRNRITCVNGVILPRCCPREMGVKVREIGGTHSPALPRTKHPESQPLKIFSHPIRE